MLSSPCPFVHDCLWQERSCQSGQQGSEILFLRSRECLLQEPLTWGGPCWSHEPRTELNSECKVGHRPPGAYQRPRLRRWLPLAGSHKSGAQLVPERIHMWSPQNSSPAFWGGGSAACPPLCCRGRGRISGLGLSPSVEQYKSCTCSQSATRSTCGLRPSAQSLV